MECWSDVIRLAQHATRPLAQVRAAAAAIGRGELATRVAKHEGTLNKFFGDGMMTVFGALSEDTHQEEHAINAALAMQQALDEHRQRLGGKFPADLRIGIGIHSGVAVIGNVGSKHRMEAAHPRPPEHACR